MWSAKPTGIRGRQQNDSDAAIQSCLTMKGLFSMAMGQTTPKQQASFAAYRIVRNPNLAIVAFNERFRVVDWACLKMLKRPGNMPGQPNKICTSDPEYARVGYLVVVKHNGLGDRFT